MPHDTERLRRIAAIHVLIGVTAELGARIVDGYGHLTPVHIDVLIAEFRDRLKACEHQLWSWEETTGLLFDDCEEPPI